MSTLLTLKHPSISMPTIWVWIVNSPNRLAYYVEAGKYQEMKYRLCASELRMEFYLDLLFDLYRPGDRLFGIFTGSKCLVATKVCIILLALQY
jgi:hypothetical protein